MAVYGPVRHQKNIIWTEASEVHIIFLWGHMAVYGPVRHKKKYYMDRSLRPYNISLVTDRSIYCHKKILYGPKLRSI